MSVPKNRDKKVRDVDVDVYKRQAKGAALGELCTYMGIPIENTVAIGDYFNDIELMRAAGHSVAMGNAPKEVQLAADTVTGRCLDGGVAEVLYGLIRKYG